MIDESRKFNRINSQLKDNFMSMLELHKKINTSDELKRMEKQILEILLLLFDCPERTSYNEAEFLEKNEIINRRISRLWK